MARACRVALRSPRALLASCGGAMVGATMATEQVAATMGAGSHGSTFGGNPLAMACANAVLDVVLGDGFLDNVDAMSKRLRKGLDDLVVKFPNHLTGVRGKGLLLGLQFQGDGSEAGAIPCGAVRAAPHPEVWQGLGLDRLQDQEGLGDKKYAGRPEVCR